MVQIVINMSYGDAKLKEVYNYVGLFEKVLLKGKLAAKPASRRQY